MLSSAIKARFRKDWPTIFLISIIEYKLLFHLFNDHVASVRPSYGPSMMPTFSVHGDGLLTSKYYRRGRGIHVGDVVHFKDPFSPRLAYVKRIGGMPGDLVCRDGTDGEGEARMIQVCHETLGSFDGQGS